MRKPCLNLRLLFAASVLVLWPGNARGQGVEIAHDCVRIQPGVNAWAEYTVTQNLATCVYTYKITNNDRLPGPDGTICTADDTFPNPPIGIPEGLRIFGLQANAPRTQHLTTNWGFNGTSTDPPNDPGPVMPPPGTNTHWNTLCSASPIANGGSETFTLVSSALPGQDQWYLRVCDGEVIRSFPDRTIAVPEEGKDIPALSVLGLGLLALLLLVSAALLLRRHRMASLP